MIIIDHAPIPWSRLLNPIWMLQSTGDDTMSWTAPTINNGAPYLPTVQNQFLRNVLWWLRNPAGNFVGYIIGLDGTNYTVTGSDNVLATTGRDCTPPVIGWRYALLKTKLMYYPFVSYYNGKVEFYLGWRPASGGFGAKLVFPGLLSS
jgi:hypothetical protein